jgi:glycerol-3-phosphate dehydrogenase
MTILRQPSSATADHFDIVIVGGGIYGAMLLLEAARRGQRALLLERQDFGAGTSFNSLRIIHGGLRYLQTLDIPRFHESVTERRWFLRTFPELVKPLPCLMPLYNRGIKRPAVLQAALWMNDLFSARRNTGLPGSQVIRNGRILDADETRQLFPGVPETGLAGAALWHDAHVPDSQRLIMEILHWACSLGAQALNYVEVTGLLQANNSVSGIQARDRESGKELEIRGRHVINATGPSSRIFAANADRDVPELFHPSLAWNILFDCTAPSTHALALTPDQAGAQTYFLHPWKSRLLAGTGHAPYRGPVKTPVLPADVLGKFLDDLNQVLPDAGLARQNIVRIYAGFLPVAAPGSTRLTKRAIIHQHARHGGPKGLISVSGIKLTTARREAEKTLQLIAPPGKRRDSGRPKDWQQRAVISMDYDWLPDAADASWKNGLLELIREESVMHLDDLVLRRSAIGDNPARAEKLAEEIAQLFDWETSRAMQEVSTLLRDPAVSGFREVEKY